MPDCDGVNFLHSSLYGALLKKPSLSQPMGFQHLFFDSFPCPTVGGWGGGEGVWSGMIG